MAQSIVVGAIEFGVGNVTRCIAQASPVPNWNDLVCSAMDQFDGLVNLANGFINAEMVLKQHPRKESAERAEANDICSNVSPARKCRDEDAGCDLISLRHQVDCQRTAQGLAENTDAPGGNIRPREQVVERGVRIAQQRCPPPCAACALAVAAIVEYQQIEASLGEVAGEADVVRDVSRIAVDMQDRRGSRGISTVGRDEPSDEGLAITRGERHALRSRESRRSWGLPSCGLVEEAFHHAAEPDDQQDHRDDENEPHHRSAMRWFTPPRWTIFEGRAIMVDSAHRGSHPFIQG